MSQIGTGCMMYVQDYDETYPLGYTWDSNNGVWGGTMWTISLGPYIQKYGDLGSDMINGQLLPGNNSVYYCPDGIFQYSANGPSDPIGHGIGYGMNDTQITSGWTQIGTLYTFPGKPLAAIDEPANLVAFADMAQLNLTSDPTMNNTNLCQPCDPSNPNSVQCGPYPFKAQDWTYTPEDPGWNFGLPGTGDYDFCPGRSRVPAFRHSQHANGSFADGHAKAIPAGAMNAAVGSPQDIWHNHP